MNQSAREQVMSSDLNRMGHLSGRELMDHAMARAVRADFYTPETNTFDDFTAAGKLSQAIPLSGATKAASLAGKAGVFDMDIGAGETELPGTPDSADVSGYQLLRWPAQTISWPGGGAPDATNPKVCLIVGTPGDALTDATNRNILLDPVTRAISPENVYKTSNPVATLSVVVGAAASTPLAPAVPAGTQALFEVVVPPSVADSTSFFIVRRAWRTIEFPGTSQHGILKGCEPYLPTDASPVLLGDIVHRLVIDGELLTWRNSGNLNMLVDTAHAPGSAPATNDLPTYMYLCGGRTAPWRSRTSLFIGGPKDYAPVIFLESTTVPDSLGYPKADLVYAGVTFPRAACCYVGVRFRAAGGVTNVPAFYDGDWIYSAQTVQTVRIGFTENTITGAVTAPLVLASSPFSLEPGALVLLGGAVTGGTGTVSVLNGDTGAFLRGSLSASPATDRMQPESAKAPVNLLHLGLAATTTWVPIPMAYNMFIPRLAR
jgi:hypothetical protein